MPDTRTICYYAMYVIGEVESNWNWTSINYNDPITIGMMQWYGTRAAALLNRVKNEMPSAYPTLAASLRADIESHDASSSWWTTRYLTRAEGNSIIEVFQNEANHVIQENQAIADFEGYISKLESWGMSQANPKPLIFAMSMYHQSPARCGDVVGLCGGSADLDLLYTTCLNNSVLGQYRTRYTTVYNRLKAWDGESAPPDFGQSGDVDTTPGGDPSGGGQVPSKVSYVIRRGDCLVLFGEDEYQDGVLFYPATGDTWTCGYNAEGAPIEGGNTGGGSETGSAAQQAIVALYRSWENQFAYSQAPGRLDPVGNGYGDCSSTVWAAYQQVSGVNPGRNTREMLASTAGRLIAEGGSSGQLPIERMQPADLVLIAWSGTQVAHVELYMGNNELWGHGGPGVGPNLTTANARAYPQYTSHWWIKRFL